MTPAITADAFWQFSLQHYRRAGVERACLHFQDLYQGNVNLALLLHWLDTQSLALPETGLTALLDTVRHSDPALQRFRAQRRTQKTHLSPEAYQTLLQQELILERQQQAEIVQCCQAFTLPSHPQPDNLAAYCQHCQAPDTLYRQLQGTH